MVPRSRTAVVVCNAVGHAVSLISLLVSDCGLSYLCFVEMVTLATQQWIPFVGFFAALSGMFCLLLDYCFIGAKRGLEGYARQVRCHSGRITTNIVAGGHM